MFTWKFQKAIGNYSDKVLLNGRKTSGSAYRIKKNASISCVVYGQIDRSKGRNPESWTAQAYDETALLQLGEVVRVLAERGATDPKAAINTILSL